MKKRIISFLLLLSTLLSIFPIVGTVVAAEEGPLPKDETSSALASEMPEGAHSFTEYDALYVGADGEKTANGGTLIGLYTAYGDDATVDIAGAKWKNKMDATGGTDIVLRDTSDALSFAKEENGFGYHATKENHLDNSTLLGLTLPSAWASLSAFTVENSAKLDLIESTEVLAKRYSAVRLDTLLALWLPANHRMTSDESYCMRWSVDGEQGWTNNFVPGKQEYAYRDAYKASGGVVGLVAAYTKTVDASGSARYHISYNTGVSYSSADSYTAQQIAVLREEGKTNIMPVFSLFNGVPGTIYAVRVYDAPLTEAEKKHNAVVDILAHAGADVGEYARMDASARALLDENLAALTVTGDREALIDTMEALLLAFGDAMDLTETMYVTEGLTFFASAYTTLSTGAYDASGTINWLNALNPSEFASLRGGYTENEKGGYTVVKDPAAYNENGSFGIYMPASALPGTSYTVEWVYNPVGITVTGENGEAERYIDDVTPTGTYQKMGIAIGPLRALQFSCYRPSGKDGQMERRWYYSATGDIGSLGWKYHHADTSWAGLAQNDVMCYSVTHDYANGTSRYRFYDNGKDLPDIYDIDAATYRTPDAAGNQFHLMVGLAGTAYALRVYDRALSKTEIMRNRLADLVYFYDLDAESLMQIMHFLGDNAYSLFAAYTDMPFTMTKEDAQAEFSKRFATIWLAYEQVGVRKDAAKDGIRYYFTCHTAAAEGMAQSGFTVEIGAIVNVGKNVSPTLEGMAYDYKIGAYDSDSGKNTPFFVNGDTFAVTVLYENLDKNTSLTQISVRGYVKLTAPDGTQTVYYTDTDADGRDLSSLFAVYEMMKNTQTVKANAETYGKLSASLDKCYEHETVYVKAGAAAGGDGTENAPFRSFADGFAKCKELLAKANRPTRYTLLLADGEYGVYETQTLTAADMPYAYSFLEITSENGKSTLTTTKNIDASFTEYTDNIWVCQLDKENGEYPCFRYLYVDGKMADLAYAGDRYSADENTYVTMFERNYDGPWGRAYDLYKIGLLTENSEGGYPADRTDLNASFERYKKKFLALIEMEGQYANESLTLDSVSASSDPAHIAEYERYKLTRLALDDLKEQYNALVGTTAAKKTAFNSLSPKLSTTHDAYKAMFLELRGKIGGNQSINFSYYEPMVETTVREEAKYYLHEDIVGDLTAAMEAGKARNKAAYEALLAKYNAASDAEKAELQEALALAEEKAGEQTWFRYALEGYGPEMHLAGQWWYNIIHVAGVDYEDTVVDKNGDTHVAVYLEKDEYQNYYVHENYTMVGRYVHMKSALSYVDGEGEYYYDEVAGKVYYYSRDGVEGKTLAHATNDYMFRIEGAKNLTLSGLHITGVDDAYLSHNDGCMDLGTEGGTGELINDGSGAWSAFDRSAILLDSCYGLSVYDCTFDELGARAIFGKGILTNIIIDGSSFVNLGANAIHFGNGTKERKWVPGECYIENITINDNYFHDIAREYYNASAIWINFGKDLSITHNTIDKCSYTAISVGYTFSLTTWDPGEIYHMYNVQIAYNYVTGFMHEIGDGGGIYVTGCNASKEYEGYFNFIHHNFVHMSNTTGNGLGHMLVGIYFDGSTSNWKCYENVVTEQSYGAVAGEDDDLFAEQDPYTVALRNRYNGTTFIYIQHIDGQITHNLLCDNNYILNVRAKDPEKQQYEVYKAHVVAERNIIEQNTRYVTDLDRIPIGAEDIIYAVGSYGHGAGPEMLYDNNY